MHILIKKKKQLTDDVQNSYIMLNKILLIICANKKKKNYYFIIAKNEHFSIKWQCPKFCLSLEGILARYVSLGVQNVNTIKISANMHIYF